MLRTLKSSFYANSDEKLKNKTKKVKTINKKKTGVNFSRSKSAPSSTIKRFKNIDLLKN